MVTLNLQKTFTSIIFVKKNNTPNLWIIEEGFFPHFLDEGKGSKNVASLTVKLDFGDSWLALEQRLLDWYSLVEENGTGYYW